MMGHREKLKGGDEYDAFSRRARKFLRFKSGQRQSIKRRFNKRIRKLTKLEIR